MEDETAREVFREAKLSVEQARELCHYAVAGRYGCAECELAVAGTASEALPVKYNPKKTPVTANEMFERSLVMARKRTPEINGDATLTVPASAATAPPEPQPEVAAPSIVPLAPPERRPNTAAAPTSSGSSTRSVDPRAKRACVVPKLEANYRSITMRTRFRLVGEALLQGDNTSERHLYKLTARSISAKKGKRTRRAVVIAVHSFLPAKLVKSLIYQSTGTAALLAAAALEAVHSWVEQDSASDCEILMIALEGQGTISARVKHSLKLLQAWRREIVGSDFVFVVSNSAGVPCSIKLLYEMLRSADFHSIHEKKVALLSMGGTLQGPYSGLDAKVVIRAYSASENAIINEMFELQREKLKITTELKRNIGYLCALNVKITMAASLADQFVPLYSAVCQQLRHPNIYRCIYVDEQCEVPSFMVKLLSVVLTMENVGYTDQGLVRDLSERVQGPVSSLGCHGKIHESAEVYHNAVRFAMETTSLVYNKPAATVRLPLGVAEPDRNLYHLPWNVRGLINDLIQIKNIGCYGLLQEIVDEYKSWEPATRAWRELKYCFAALEELTLDELVL